MRWLSMSSIFSRASSARRIPVAYNVVIMTRWYALLADSISLAISSSLKTVGNRMGKNAPEKLGVAYTAGKHQDVSLMSYNPDRPTIDPNYKGKGTAKQAGGPIPNGQWTISEFDPVKKTQGALSLRPDESVRAIHSLRDFENYPFLIHATEYAVVAIDILALLVIVAATAVAFVGGARAVVTRASQHTTRLSPGDLTIIASSRIM